MKKITVVTGSRSEYGLLRNLCKLLEDNVYFSLNIVITGSHLSKLHGNTYREILLDGYSSVDMLNLFIKDDTPLHINNLISLCIKKFSEFVEKQKPDIVLILGDRYEIFGIATACMFHNIPIAHIHGGEVTFGAIDDTIRHCITKMSYLHFTSTEEYRNRVIQLGEKPDKVFNCGGLGAEAIKKVKLLSKSKLEKALNFKFMKKNLLITYHPETLARDQTLNDLNEILDALSKLDDINLIFTLPNADIGHKNFFKMINKFVEKNQSYRIAFTSLGQKLYFSCLQFVDGVLGNSSSGLLEVPSFKIGTINIGDRQLGRIKSSSIIDVKAEKRKILDAINLLYSPKFKRILKTTVNPYLKNKTSEKIVEILKITNLKNTKKHFHDIKSIF